MLSEAKHLVITWNNEIFRRYAAQNDISLGALNKCALDLGEFFEYLGLFTIIIAGCKHYAVFLEGVERTAHRFRHGRYFRGEVGVGVGFAIDRRCAVFA